MISLSRAGLDDTTLQEMISFLPERCIALMEDIDAVFVDPGVNRDQQKNQSDNNERSFGNKGGYVLSPFIYVFLI